VLAAEHDVELESLALKKELRLFDLFGIQILNIVGLFWVGTAGKLGSSHVMFWIPGVLLFYIPSGIVVAHLVKECRSKADCISGQSFVSVLSLAFSWR
jgi:hypothetical protein